MVPLQSKYDPYQNQAKIRKIRQRRKKREEREEEWREGRLQTSITTKYYQIEFSNINLKNHLAINKFILCQGHRLVLCPTIN
jgi:Tfp pilus assembly major pilin PilA